MHFALSPQPNPNIPLSLSFTQSSGLALLLVGARRRRPWGSRGGCWGISRRRPRRCAAPCPACAPRWAIPGTHPRRPLVSGCIRCSGSRRRVAALDMTLPRRTPLLTESSEPLVALPHARGSPDQARIELLPTVAAHLFSPLFSLPLEENHELSSLCVPPQGHLFCSFSTGRATCSFSTASSSSISTRSS